MCLHVTVLFVHTFFIVMLQAVTIYTFLYPAPENYAIMVISRMVA